MAATHTYSEDFNEMPLMESNAGKMKEPQEFMKKPLWVLYTFLVFIGFIESILLFVGGIVFTVHQIVNEVIWEERYYDIREEIVVVYFLTFSQVMVYWYGIKARKELESDHQERFKNFFKAQLNLFTALIVLYIKFCLDRNLIFVDSGYVTWCQYILYFVLGKFVIMRFVQTKSRELDEYLKKYEAYARYQQSAISPNDDKTSSFLQL